MAAAAAGTAVTRAANPRVLALFDIDGTLTIARKTIEPAMKEFMRELRSKVTVGIVGGSDLVKAQEQLGDDLLTEYDYVFSENGLTAFKAGTSIGVQSIAAHLGEDNIKRFVNFTLRYLSEVDIPVKRGTFIEFRSGMLNVSPIGRNCSREERNAFEVYDKEHGIRKAMVEALQKEFADLDLSFSIGGQISFDVFPRGWDKTFCLRFLDPADFDEIHFFGDKTFEGGNDYEIYVHERTVGHHTTGPDDTMGQLRELFFKEA